MHYADPVFTEVPSFTDDQGVLHYCRLVQCSHLCKNEESIKQECLRAQTTRREEK